MKRRILIHDTLITRRPIHVVCTWHGERCSKPALWEVRIGAPPFKGMEMPSTRAGVYCSAHAELAMAQIKAESERRAARFVKVDECLT